MIDGTVRVESSEIGVSIVALAAVGCALTVNRGLPHSLQH